MSNVKKKPEELTAQELLDHIDNLGVNADPNIIIPKATQPKLSAYPKNGEHYIELFCEAFGIELLNNNMYRWTKPFIHEDKEYSRETIEKLINSKNDESRKFGAKLKILYDEPFSLELFLSHLKQFAYQHKEYKIKDQAITAGHTIWFDKKKQKQKDDLFNSIAYRKPKDNGEYNQELWEVVIGLITDENQKLTTATLQHFIWQVKRKILGLEVLYHLMPIPVSEQGWGKSKFIEAFLSPVGFVTTDFNNLSDDRQISLFQDNWILFLDEMQGAKKAEIELIKGIISATHRTARLFGTQKTVTFRQNATFIGAANKDIPDLIRDSAMRRFYQIVFKKIEKENYDVINNQIEWIDLWRSVDENGPPPILKFKKELEIIQETYKEISSLENWLNSLDEKTFIFNHSYTATELYSRFSEYDKAAANGYVKFNAWSRQMSKDYKGYKIIKERTSKGMVYKIIKEDLC